MSYGDIPLGEITLCEVEPGTHLSIQTRIFLPFPTRQQIPFCIII